MRGALFAIIVAALGCEASPVTTGGIGRRRPPEGPIDDAPPTPRLQFGPCVPQRVKHVREFGYYASAAYLPETAPYSTLIWGTIDDTVQAQTAGLRAVVDLQGVFRIAWPDRGSDEEIEAAWRAAAHQLLSLRGTIAALYPSDEPYFNGWLQGIPLAEIARRLEHAAALIHATPGFEGTELAVIFADPELDWMTSGEARNPAGYAWVGFDRYGEQPDLLEERGAVLLSLLRPGQRVIAVPDALLFHDGPQDLDALDERIAFWLAWIERHPEVVAVTPFIYPSRNNTVEHWIGAADLPEVRERYRQIGSCIIDAAAPSPAP